MNGTAEAFHGFTTLCSLTAFLWLAPLLAQAEGDYTYITTNGTITITGYTGPGGAVTIPGSIAGLPVTTIRDYAFYGCSNLTSVTIANSVTSIGESAFFGCISVTSVTIPASVTSIGAGAFASCPALIAIAVDLNNAAYTSVEGVLFTRQTNTVIQYPAGQAGSYTLPDGVTSIGRAAFLGCSQLTSVSIPNSVTNIGLDAFTWCTSLTSVVIPNSVTSIGHFAFFGSGLTTATIPSSVTTIGARAFSECTNLAGVYFWGGPPGYDFYPPFGWACTNTVYYLPGIPGWEPLYAGRPTALWQLPQPVILTFRPDFGLQTNAFGFRISWATNASVAVEASASPTGSNWLPLATNALVNGWTYFSDPDWPNHQARFYRVRSP